MPCLRPSNSTRNDDQTCTRLNQRVGRSRIIATAIQKFKVDIRHPYDVRDGGRCIHSLDVAGLVPDQLGPAIRIEGNGDRSACILEHGERLGCSAVVGERGRPDMNGFDLIEGDGAAPIDPVSGRGPLVVEGILRLAGDGAHERKRRLVLAPRRISKLDLPKRSVEIPPTNPAGAPRRAMPTAMLRQEPPATGTSASRPSTDLTGRKSIKASPQLSSIVLIFRIDTGDQFDSTHRVAAFPIQFSHQSMDLSLGAVEFGHSWRRRFAQTTDRRHRGH